jgi:ElaB/YqjD/DUF883 family membrane-anchored ribosome-binding protein
MAQSSYGREANAMSDLQDEAAEQLGRASDQAMKQGRVASERMQKLGSNFKSALDKSIVEQPMATLAIAATLGFVLGALWKS